MTYIPTLTFGHLNQDRNIRYAIRYRRVIVSDTLVGNIWNKNSKYFDSEGFFIKFYISILEIE